MDLTETDDQRMIRSEARRLLEAACPPELVRSFHVGSAGDAAELELRRKLAAAGWMGLTFDESLGGGGGTIFDLALFFYEAGRVLLPSTVASSLFAGLLVERLGTAEQRERYLPRICSGDLLATVAYLERDVLHDWSLLSTATTRRSDGSLVVNGTKLFVANGDRAELVVVLVRLQSAEHSPEVGLVLLDGAELPGVERRPLHTFAGDRQSELGLTNVVVGPDSILGGSSADVAATWAKVLDTMTALQVMEMSGGISRVVEMTAEYVSVRQQFGRPIGSFQAVQHHVANMGLRSEGARLLATRAAWLVSEDLPAGRQISEAKVWASDAYPEVTLLAHQVHGGMGYVTESALPLYSGRAKAAEVSFGTRERHLARIACFL
jgi:alkylation response protein AidB-like acyl-CoA dehydrogenase